MLIGWTLVITMLEGMELKIKVKVCKVFRMRTVWPYEMFVRGDVIKSTFKFPTEIL